MIPADNFLDLVKHDKPIVGGVAYTYVNGNFQPTMYQHKEGLIYSPQRDAKLMNGLFETDSTGGACLAIRRDVLEKMKKPYFKFEYDEETRNRDFGEDFYFCREAKRLGYPIFVDTDVIFDHIKELSMFGAVKTVKAVTKHELERYHEEKKALAKKIMAERLAKQKEVNVLK
jgi:GT2 family glycosyltransferase